MIKRTLFFSNPYYLSIKNKQLIITNKDTGEIKQTPVEDIGFVIFDNPQITITQWVMQEMAENNVAVVFCNKQHLPSSMLFNLSSHNLQNEIFRSQVDVKEPIKKALWKQTIEYKIKNQASLLKKLDKDYKQMQVYANNVKSGDTTNQEAQASRYYWKHLFDLIDFKRERFGMPPNTTLNYGYAILRAAVARALVGSGLLPTLGIHHHNKYNAYCLADDIMEPYRPFVDEIVCEIIDKYPNYHIMTKEIKAELLQLLTVDVRFDDMKRPLMIGISTTTASLARCFAGTQKKILYPIL